MYSSLQGEIHMSDDAIHDILEQTESDPAFQALYDLFDYSNYDPRCFYCFCSFSTTTGGRFITDLIWCVFLDKTKFTDGEPGDGDNGTTPEESEAAGPFSVVRPLQNDDAGIL